MKQKYLDHRFTQDALALIVQVNRIIETYTAKKLRLSLRQLYYQLVVRNIVPNTEKSYKRVGGIVADGRLAGLIDWDAIEARVRVPKSPVQFDNLQDLAEVALQSYRLDRWKGQPNYVELWVEKDALAGVLLPLAREYHVTLMVNRGYSSSSAMKDSAERFLAARQNGKDTNLLYLGDHDPSGEDMVRDVQARLQLFHDLEGLDGPDVRKIALTMAQVEEYKPPPNPAKMTDSRAAGYVEKFGTSSWEVDALPPEVLAQIVRERIENYFDKELMDAVKEQEEKDKTRLRAAVGKLSEDEKEEQEK